MRNLAMTKSCNLIARVELYYQAMLAKDFETMATYLHDDVHLISPLAAIRGKSSVVAAAKNLSNILRNIVFRSKICSESKVMCVYDFICDVPINTLRAAALFEFKDDYIVSIELFYDSRPFVEQKNTIFE